SREDSQAGSRCPRHGNWLACSPSPAELAQRLPPFADNTPCRLTVAFPTSSRPQYPCASTDWCSRKLIPSQVKLLMQILSSGLVPWRLRLTFSIQSRHSGE